MSLLLRSIAAPLLLAGAVYLGLCGSIHAQYRPGAFPASYGTPPPIVHPYIPPAPSPVPHAATPTYPTLDLYNNFPYYGRYKLPGYYGQYPYDPASGYPSYYDLKRREAGPSVPENDSDEEADTSAHVYVKVPAKARVWFDGKATTSMGSERAFTSPPLPAGHRYQYQVRASWNDNGREVTQTQHVTVSAGDKVQVAFPAPE